MSTVEIEEGHIAEKMIEEVLMENKSDKSNATHSNRKMKDSTK